MSHLCARYTQGWTCRSPPEEATKDLRARLAAPLRSPEEISADINERAARSSRLRKLHLESIKLRGERETQLAREAAARKLRVAHMVAERSRSRHVQAEEKKTLREVQLHNLREHNKAKHAAHAEANSVYGEAEREIAEANRGDKGQENSVYGEASGEGKAKIVVVDDGTPDGFKHRLKVLAMASLSMA